MADDKSLAPKDEIELALQKAELKAQRERNTKIGTLLDKATDVLSSVLDSDDPNMANARMRAAEVAINLYVQQDNGQRQERALRLQQRRLDLEEEKMRQPGGALYQQNNVYINGQPQGQVGTSEEEQARLLARKRAADDLLATYLPPKKEDKVIEVVEETPAETSPDAVLSTDTDKPTGDNN